jgi:hypothetical protein
MSTQEPEQESPPPAPWQTPSVPKRAPARSRQIIAWLVMALVIVLIVVGASPWWGPGLAPLLPWGQRAPAATVDNSAAAIHDLQTRLDADEAALKDQAAKLARLGAIDLVLKDQAARLTQIEARPITPAKTEAPPPAPSTPATESPDSTAAIKALQDQLAKLSADANATGERVGRLETKVETASVAGRADRTLLLALANLRSAVQGSGPFAAELAAAQALANDKADMKDALASLEGDAKTGLPTTAQLADRFNLRTATVILRARGDAKSGDWWDQIRAHVEKLVVIRRIAPGGSTMQGGVAASVQQADFALKAGDLAGAVAALGDLSGEAGAAGAPWLVQAKKRLAAETTLTKLWRDELARSGDKP